MKKYIFKRILALVLVVATLFSFGACKPKHKNAITPKVILFIGDGMGPNHVYNAELYYGEEMYFSSFPYQTTVDTNSLSGLTDSAAAATAMATGVRVENDFIAVDVSTGKDLTSITELAKEQKYGTGVVTSDLITGATPAGFSAHCTSRDNETEILISQKDAKLDLLLGAGEYKKYEYLFDDAGWTWIDSFDELKLKNRRYVSNFSSVVPENPTQEEPTLTQLACFAVEYMEKNYPTGYFLMIEGAKIDKASHSNDINTMLKNMMDFSNAIKAVEEMLPKTVGYTILVTADHETGGLKKAESIDKLTNGLYTTAKHTATPVGLYYKSTQSGVPEIISESMILNTDIFLLCKYLLAL